MAEIHINNQKTDIHINESDSIDQVMDKVLNEVISEKDVIVGIDIDEKELSFDDESIVLSKRATLFDTINFKTQNSIELAMEALDSSAEYIDHSIGKIKETLELFKDDHINQGNERFAEVLEITDLFIQLITRVNRTLHSELSIRPQKDSLIQQLEVHLLSILKGLIPARENNDIIMLCDLLEYELIDNLTQWKEKVIPEIKELKSS